MTPQAKAQILYKRIEGLQLKPSRKISKAKHMTLAFIDEVQKVAQRGCLDPDYWRQVREEIEKL